jgi:hypothetical protein
LLIEIAHAVADRDAAPISRLIDICRGERKTVLNEYSPEEMRAYIEGQGPREAVFVAIVDGEFAGFAAIAPRYGYSDRLRHCAEGGTRLSVLRRGRFQALRVHRHVLQQGGDRLLREPGVQCLWLPQADR